MSNGLLTFLDQGHERCEHTYVLYLQFDLLEDCKNDSLRPRDSTSSSVCIRAAATSWIGTVIGNLNDIWSKVLWVLWPRNCAEGFTLDEVRLCYDGLQCPEVWKLWRWAFESWDKWSQSIGREMPHWLCKGLWLILDIHYFPELQAV